MLLLFGWNLAVATELPRAAPVPGGIAIVKLGSDERAPPRVRFNDQPVLTARDRGHWWAIVGIPLESEPGLQLLQRTHGATQLDPLPFFVEPKQYRAQHLKLRNKNMVDPDAATLNRIAREAQLRQQALTTWSDSPPTSLRFDLPAKGRFSSEFGLRRYFNGKPRRPHSGLDIAAGRGARIAAPAAGTVVATGDWFFNGKTVFIDHGRGLITMYCHLQRIDVVSGQTLTSGEAIGAVGSSGRATGPHLHWSVALNGVLVEPRLFLED